LADRPSQLFPAHEPGAGQPATPATDAPQAHALAHLSDADLVAVAQSGASDGITLLYERHHLWVYRFLLANLGNQQNAEDTTQDVFVKVLHKLDTFKGAAGTFSGWLFRIARNTLTDQLRSNQRSKQVALTQSDHDPSHTNVEQIAEHNVLIQQISREIAELTLAPATPTRRPTLAPAMPTRRPIPARAIPTHR